MNLFELFVKIGVNDQASGNIASISKKLGNGLKTSAKIGTAAVAAASTAIFALTTQAVNSFAEYEQLAGGAQKIFDQMDYSKIAADANSAFKELGLSANQYLAVINDVGATFAATMGDEAGYEAAKTGLKAISDYASGTGKNVDELSQKFTLITRSTSSYQSIADQFSGILPATSKDFLAQAQAAGLLSTKYKQLTQVPIAEYQAAVSKMLEKGVTDLGLYNNTVDEAFSTLSGSLNMAKSSWSNLITGIADENADLGMLVGNFVDSISAVATNVLPVVNAALNGIVSLINNLAPKIVEELPGLIESILPNLVTAASSLLSSVANVLPSLLNIVFQTALPSLLSGLQSVFDSLLSVLPSLIESITSYLPTTLPQILTAAVSLISSLAASLPLIIAPILENLPSIFQALVGAIAQNAPILLTAILDMLTEIVAMYGPFIDAFVAVLPDLFSALGPALISALPVLMESIGKLLLEVGKLLPQLIIMSVLSSTGLLYIFTALYGILKPYITEDLLGKIGEFFTEMMDGLKVKLLAFVDIGKNIVDGIKEGIKNAWSNLKEWFTNLFGDLIGIAKKILGIASPSKVFKKIGLQTAQGYQIGFDDEFENVRSDMEDALNFDDASIGINASIRKVGAGAAGMAYGGVSYGDINIYVNGDRYRDEEALADAIAERLQQMTNRRVAAYV